MGDDLIYQDVLLWSEREGALLRRLAAGERVNDAIDWENVIEEIESLGRSELHAVESLLVQAMAHLIKIAASPDGPTDHWRQEIAAFLVGARRKWAPSMAQRVDMDALFEDAIAVVRTGRQAGADPRGVPARSPFALTDLILPERTQLPDIDALVARVQEPVGNGR